MFIMQKICTHKQIENKKDRKYGINAVYLLPCVQIQAALGKFLKRKSQQVYYYHTTNSEIKALFIR